jgi:hypothetical protein
VAHETLQWLIQLLLQQDAAAWCLHDTQVALQDALSMAITNGNGDALRCLLPIFDLYPQWVPTKIYTCESMYVRTRWRILCQHGWFSDPVRTAALAHIFSIEDSYVMVLFDTGLPCAAMVRAWISSVWNRAITSNPLGLIAEALLQCTYYMTLRQKLWNLPFEYHMLFTQGPLLNIIYRYIYDADREELQHLHELDAYCKMRIDHR